MQKGHKPFSAYLQPVLIFCFFAVILAAGLRVYDDYGPVSEEKNQIDAGHIIWAHITGDNSHYTELPALENYMNRYYGQGATFVTVLLEAAFMFSWDINRVWKVRRLWNFLCFFMALICLFGLVKKRYKRTAPACLAVLNLVLLPRMFPEVFYNDRDPLFLTWLVFSFTAMMLFLGRTNLLTALLFGAVLAVTVNIRMFGLIFLIPLVLIFLYYPSKRRWLGLILLVFVLVWYALSPIYWKAPFKTLWTSVVHLTTKQRMIDTRGTSELLFAGKYYPEQSLPWFYLPLWMLISTPLVLLCLSAFGAAARFRCVKKRDESGFFLMDYSLAAFFLLFFIGIPLIRPTLYSGWRHFYFLNLSLVWFAVYGLDRILRIKKLPLKWALLLTEALSFVLTLVWMTGAHPYEGVYFSPLFRQRAAGNFERDTGFISTLECLEYLAETEPGQKIEVMNANAFIPYALIGLPKQVRERFSTIDWKMQRTPMKYVIFNYNNRQGNDEDFPYYAPVFHIERAGMKLAEVFQRTNHRLLDPAVAVESVHASFNDSDVSRILSDDGSEIWSGAPVHEKDETVTLCFSDGVQVESMELFPGDAADVSEALTFQTSADGTTDWQTLPAEKYGTNGWLFSSLPEKYLRIQSSVESNQPWQVRQILLYGK